MSSIYSLLGLGARSFLSLQSGMASVGHNVTNANTPGFRRTRVDLRAELAPPFGGGVRSLGLQRIDDPLLSKRERSSASDLGHAEDLLAAVSALEGAISPDGNSDLVAAISDFFGAITGANASPTDPNRRRAVIEAGRDLAEKFQELHSSVRAAIEESNQRIVAYADRATALAEELAQLNREASINSDPTLLDRRDQVAAELSSLTGGNVIESEQGHRFMLEDGTVLVDGKRAARIEANGRLEVVDGASRRDITSSAGGRIAGQLELRDRIAPGLAGQLDQLAFDLATEVNAAHRAHAGLDGVSGRDFFTQPTSVAGAAAAIAVDPALLGDHRLLASADPSLGPGSNAGLTSLGALTDRFSNAAIETMANLGREVAGARRDQSLQTARAETLASLRDSLSGVSIEEEMVRLSEFQRAAEASMQFVRAVDGMLEELIRSL